MWNTTYISVIIYTYVYIYIFTYHNISYDVYIYIYLMICKYIYICICIQVYIYTYTCKKMKNLLIYIYIYKWKHVYTKSNLTGPYVISPHVGGSTSYLQSLLKPYLVKEMKDNRNWAHSKMHTNVGTGGEPWDRTHPWQLGIPSSRNVIVSATATCGFVSFEGGGKNALRKVPGYLKGTPNSLRYLGSGLFRPTLTDMMPMFT